MIAAELRSCRAWIDEALLNHETKFNWHSKLSEAARYTVLGQGKCLRPYLLFKMRQHFLGEAELHRPSGQVLNWGLALELIHTYSLIHDDLPAMDNDDFRRGRPTLHRTESEALAILAGDALLTGAFELLAADRGADAQHTLDAVGELARAAGGAGMVSGQVRDMFEPAAHNADDNLSALKKTHAEKTGALFAAAAVLGALSTGRLRAGLPTQELRQWGEDFGLLFQITDDVLDVTGSRESLGKTPLKDQNTNKRSYVQLLTLQGAQREAARVAEKLKTYQSLKDLVDFVLNRSS
jgi:geranylgeranyl diphosphate synthase type II